ncbi:9859_t:CDS:2, partial [Acaulospora morrowiae]
GDVHVNSVSDFHLLTFVKGTNVLDMNDFAALARLATSHEEKDAIQLSQSAGWQTLVAIMKSGSKLRHVWFTERCLILLHESKVKLFVVTLNALRKGSFVHDLMLSYIASAFVIVDFPVL